MAIAKGGTNLHVSNLDSAAYPDCEFPTDPQQVRDHNTMTTCKEHVKPCGDYVSLCSSLSSYNNRDLT